jgi:signal transduction histidine kinase/CheY-like chemotaxis protein
MLHDHWMKNSRQISIRTRLILLITITIVTVQAISLGLSVWHEINRYALTKKEAMFSTAEIIAASAAKSLAERDSDGAYQAIRAIGRIKGMSFAGLEDRNGQLFADVGATEQLAGDIILSSAASEISPLAFLRSKSVEVTVPVIYAGEKVGSFKLLGETGDLAQRIEASLRTTVSASLIALGLALALVFHLQASITNPLRSLSDAMIRITRNHNFTVSLPKVRNDEVGMLVEGFNAMMSNIRERDDRLTAHRARLEYDIAERTKDYQKAAAEADLANSAKSDFLATMSHEIRTPMNGILVMAELLATADLPSREKRQAEVIARSGNSLLAIINDILDFSKIEAGKLEVETIDLDAAIAVDTVLHLFADRAQSKGLDLTMQFDLNRDAGVIADPVRLGQVLGNLVNNALKFTEKGGVTVEVKESDARQGFVTFSVTDTGIGIATDKLGSIFEAFSQADQTTTRKFGGTGLGLSIARKLVAAMGGELNVESELAVGTRFFFSLPASQTRLGTAWPTISSVRRAVTCLEGKQSEKAIILALQAAGFDVRTASKDDVGLLSSGATLVVADHLTLQKLPRLPIAAAGAVLALAKPTDDITPLLNARQADAALNWPVLRSDLVEIIDAVISGRALRSLDLIDVPLKADGAELKGLRVLVADDSEVNREVAQAALQKLGVTPDLVVNGREAYESVFAKHYDVVLMDGSMPELDGFESTKLIRSREQAEGQRRTPIIALTAHVIGTAADSWRHAGMDGVLHKPFTTAQMLNILRPHVPLKHEEQVVPREFIKPLAAKPDEPKSVETEVLNLAVINELREMTKDSPEVIDRIVKLYCNQSDEHLRMIVNAVADQNIELLGSAAHALKSMSYNVGATIVAALANEMEQAAREEGRVASLDRANELNQQLQAAKAVLLRQIA